MTSQGREMTFERLRVLENGAKWWKQTGPAIKVNGENFFGRRKCYGLGSEG
jgi:hypothetical protein